MSFELAYFKPFCKIIPEVKKPDRKVKFSERVLWTVVILVLYLVCCQLPLFGIMSSDSQDPFYWLRMIQASNRGSLMELGMSPIINSGLIMQVLVGANIIRVADTPDDQKNFDSVQKLFGLIMTIGQATLYVKSGIYGNPADMGPGICLLLVLQMFTSGVLVILMDDLLQKGYGFGSGISLFIATNTCETIIWQALSPTTINRGKGTEFEGAIIAFFHLLTTKPDKVDGIKEALFRKGRPNLSSILATVMIFAVVIYLQGFKVDIPILSTRYRGQRSSYAIRLFYTSTMPILLQSALFSNVFMVSHFLSHKFPNTILSQILGVWGTNKDSSHYAPVSGLCYYLQSPDSLSDLLTDPLHFFVYVTLMLSTCAWFSHLWIRFSQASPKDVMKRLKENQMRIGGHRDSSMLHVLHRYIPTAAVLGGICIGVLSVIGDLFGAIGSGSGILMTVSTINHYVEAFIREQIEKRGESVMQILF